MKEEFSKEEKKAGRICERRLSEIKNEGSGIEKRKKGRKERLMKDLVMKKRRKKGTIMKEG